MPFSDDDELLYFDMPFSRIVDGLAPGVTCVVLVNIEAVPKSLDSDCVFEDIEVFSRRDTPSSLTIVFVTDLPERRRLSSDDERTIEGGPISYFSRTPLW